jgi:membrane protease YdiL (CAAX protease family)
LAATPCLIVFLDEVSFLQSRWTGQENDLLTQFLQAISLGQWIKLGVCMAVIPAVCEESLFRGYLLDRLSIQDQQWRAIMVSSVLFGLFHQGFQMVVPAALAGVFFAFVAARTESLFNPIASHSVVNAWALLAANSGLQKRSGHLPFVLLAICFVGILLLGSLLRKGK